MAKKNDGLKEMLDKIWPKTKKELEKGIVEAKKMLGKGEKYLKQVSERGVIKTKKLSLGLKKEKLYYDLGKALAKTQASEWPANRKISSLLGQIKNLDQQIRKIK
ncbi:MAG: hypothetical protein KKH93_00255 [Candidatus Omnitrophica bacterium]|nr:hypothetical protein [Candidatus Omnitrophota bacterium]MBU2044412.1 hypothetical protein [Candidatus Omnitrophota bacterium]MBU2473748.1 hypothetical protein [Candidatus Omnitrophota bacterium]